eukprot:13992415-Heterocapsa_arctica.AAC.1
MMRRLDLSMSMLYHSRQLLLEKAIETNKVNNHAEKGWDWTKIYKHAQQHVENTHATQAEKADEKSEAT